MRDRYADHQLNRHNPRNWFQGHAIISDQIEREGLEVVWQQLELTLAKNIPGDIVELGCYVGTTSLFIRRLLDATKQSEHRAFHVYDSFEGLPDKTTQDENAAGVDFEAGKLFVSKREFTEQFVSAHLTPPIIHKGWFEELLPESVPKEIAFAFLDGDFYTSILSSLRLIYPHMAPGSRILIDDYQHETLPGVERAVHDFFQGKTLRLRSEAHIAIIEL